MSQSAQNQTTSQTKPNRIPALRGSLLFGCAEEMRRDPLPFYYQAWQKHGDLVRIHLVPGIHLYTITHPETIEYVLQKNYKNYRKPDFFNDPVSLLTGKGLLTSEGQFWLKQRRTIQPAFRKKHLYALTPKMIKAAEEYVDKFKEVKEGEAIDILEEMMQLTLKIASTTLFSSDISHQADAIGQALRLASEHVSYKMNSIPIPAWLPTPRNLRFRKAKAFLDKVTLEVIEERRGETDPPQDLLSLLLAAQDEESGDSMSDEQLKNEVLTLLIAGHETAGASLSWTWYLLCQHPEIQEKMFEEIHQVLRGRSPTQDDLEALPLTHAVFKEAMRLYPPAWGQSRQAIEADTLHGYTIPAGSNIIVSTSTTHKRTDLWEDPEAFRPERFLDDSKKRHKFAYLPFGGGPRVCIGQGFAMLEGPLLLATLLQQFRFKLAPNQTIEADPAFTLRPKPGIQMFLSPRKT